MVSYNIHWFLLSIENALLEDDNTFHLVRPADDLDEVKSKRGSMKDKAMTKAITEIYLTRLLSVKVCYQSVKSLKTYLKCPVSKDPLCCPICKISSALRYTSPHMFVSSRALCNSLWTISSAACCVQVLLFLQLLNISLTFWMNKHRDMIMLMRRRYTYGRLTGTNTSTHKWSVLRFYFFFLTMCSIFTLQIYYEQNKKTQEQETVVEKYKPLCRSCCL